MEHTFDAFAVGLVYEVSSWIASALASMASFIPMPTDLSQSIITVLV